MIFKNSSFKLRYPLKHIAFIMDGNGRFAARHFIPREAGHKAGVERIEDICIECQDLGIEVMSLYVFSTENWKRSQKEIDCLFDLLDEFLTKKLGKLQSRGVKVIVSGLNDRFRDSTRLAISKAQESTKMNKKFILNLCINYGGQQEIVEASKTIAHLYKDNLLDVDSLTTDSFFQYLFCSSLPPIDFLIRTSGEKRISNFMLYQLAYAEMSFPKVYWPAFTIKKLHKVLKEYNSRDRRFGGRKNEPTQ